LRRLLSPIHHAPLSLFHSLHTRAHTHTQELQSKDLPSTRIQPARRWFGNTRVVGQKQLEQFRTEMATKVNDSYTVLLKEKKLPLQLLEDPEKKLKGKQV
jgi:nuclear GTP-binding protein